MQDSSATIRFRKPTPADAPSIHRLVGESGVLDENSLYLYLLLCRDFAATCLIAEIDTRVVAFVTAYCPPDRENSLFVWQIGVHADARRQGLGLRLLIALTERVAFAEEFFVEATIADANVASTRLFAKLAEHYSTEFAHLPTEGFTKEDFGTSGHEPEPLVRIGPIKLKNQVDPPS